MRGVLVVGVAGCLLALITAACGTAISPAGVATGPAALPTPLVRAGALSTARFLRWAFDGSPNRRVHPKDVTAY